MKAFGMGDLVPSTSSVNKSSNAYNKANGIASSTAWQDMLSVFNPMSLPNFLTSLTPQLPGMAQGAITNYFTITTTGHIDEKELAIEIDKIQSHKNSVAHSHINKYGKS